jgi:hypothetical protein
MFSHDIRVKSARGLVKHCKTQLSFSLSFTQVHNTHPYMKALLQLNREHLRWVVWLFTEHCPLKAHLFELGLTDDLTCEWCLKKDELATHILCDLRFCHLHEFYMEPSDYYETPINKVLHFTWSVGLITGWSKNGKHKRSLKVPMQGPDYYDPSSTHPWAGIV